MSTRTRRWGREGERDLPGNHNDTGIEFDARKQVHVMLLSTAINFVRAEPGYWDLRMQRRKGRGGEVQD